MITDKYFLVKRNSFDYEESGLILQVKPNEYKVKGKGRDLPIIGGRCKVSINSRDRCSLM